MGMKTTNAKAFQTPGGFETGHKPLQQQNSARPQRQRTKQAEAVKLEIHTDLPLSHEDREPEYCPPKWIEPPYVNDDIDVESLDYSIVHKAAQSDAFRMRYGGAAARRKVKEQEEKAKRRQEREDEEFLKRMAEEDVFIEDVPETHPKKAVEEPVARSRAPLHQRSASAFVRKPTTTSRPHSTAPSTISSRRAASALGGIDSSSRTISSRPLSTSTTYGHSRSTSSGTPLAARNPITFGLGASRKPALSTTRPTSAVPNTTRSTSALANSRTTIGYTKGRTASSALNAAILEPTPTATRDPFTRPSSRGCLSSSSSIRPRMGLSRSATTVSMGSSEYTVTPAKWARQQDHDIGTPKSLLEAFEGTQEEDKDDLGVAHIRLGGEVELPDCLKPQPGEEEEFFMTLNF